MAQTLDNPGTLLHVAPWCLEALEMRALTNVNAKILGKGSQLELQEQTLHVGRLPMHELQEKLLEHLHHTLLDWDKERLLIVDLQLSSCCNGGQLRHQKSNAD